VGAGEDHGGPEAKGVARHDCAPGAHAALCGANRGATLMFFDGCVLVLLGMLVAFLHRPRGSS
jgi:hypothetical protein